MSDAASISASTTGDPFADLRHDLRNPIGHILGYAEMLEEEAEDAGDAASPDLARIRTAAKSLLSLIDERLRPDVLRVSGVATSAASASAVASRLFVDEAALAQSPIVSPAAPPAPSTRATVPFTPVAAARAGDTPREGIVLVVDDVEENRQVLARRLQRLGHRVVTAEGGSEALALLSGQGFDLVLLDIMMPGMDGYEVLRRIKADATIASTPVVVVSALDEVESVARCIEMGAEDYLTKPFNPTLLKARVTASLRAKRAHDREIRLNEEVQTNYEKVLTAEKMRDDLTGMIVHDLRTPLTSVLSGLQTLDALGDMDDVQQEMLQISTDGAQTLLGMINDLLDISKLEDGSLKLEYSDVSASGLAERARKQIALLAKSKNLTIAEQIAFDVPLFRGDDDKLRRTLVNLLGNALKFTPSEGTITIGAEMEGDAVRFFVRDTGEGIPKESFGRIFEKFGQVENRKGGRKMSTGLGLTFCKMAVEAHGGNIWVDSELGVGSTFYFTIPVVPPAS